MAKAKKNTKVTITKHTPKAAKKTSTLAVATDKAMNNLRQDAIKKTKHMTIVQDNDDPLLRIKVDAHEHYYIGIKQVFKITRREEKRDGEPYQVVELASTAPEMSRVLRDITGDTEFYNTKPVMEASNLFTYMPNLQSHEGMAYVDAVLAFLRKEFKDSLEQFANIQADGLVPFNMLWMLYHKGMQVVSDDLGSPVASEVISCRYKTGFSGTILEITVKSLVQLANKFGLTSKKLIINAFNGMVSVKSLPVQALNEATKAMLVARTTKLFDVSSKASYVHHSGNMAIRTYFGYQLLRSDGRIMVDHRNFNRVNPNYNRFDDHDVQDSWETIPKEYAHMGPSRVFGFSFSTKRWGEFFVDNISPIVFRPESFETLVLPKETKDMITALVANGTSSFSDIIDGKGGGCIFLLHGEPGVGKTLTAESTAELMKRPLYSVSVGELGTTTESLEENLREILDMATIWNALILIDEADIFLEARSDSNDIDRNAMIAIFLRLLEYHQGVMFLTTNRVLSFDTAFHSRISLAIRYTKLTVDGRRSIWTNLLKAAKIEGIDVERLMHYNINGRQIKTAIRLGQALANNDKTPITIEHLIRPIEHQELFLKQIREHDVTQLRLESTEPVIPHEPSARERITDGNEMNIA